MLEVETHIGVISAFECNEHMLQQVFEVAARFGMSPSSAAWMRTYRLMSRQPLSPCLPAAGMMQARYLAKLGD